MAEVKRMQVKMFVPIDVRLLTEGEASVVVAALQQYAGVGRIDAGPTWYKANGPTSQQQVAARIAEQIGWLI